MHRPLLAPFIGGFITESYLGWRWTEYLTAILGFLAFGLNLFFLEETYPPAILVGKAAELRRRTKNWGIHAKQEEIELDWNELITKVKETVRLILNLSRTNSSHLIAIVDSPAAVANHVRRTSVVLFAS